MKTLECIVLLRYRTIIVGAVAELVREAIEIDALQEVKNSLCTHLSDELIGIGILEILILTRKLI